MLIIQANNIHESGAKYLLLSMLKSIGASEINQRVTVFLDRRFDRALLTGLIDDRKVTVRTVDSTVHSRIWSEFAISRLAAQNSGTTLLCLGNIPPLFSCDANVILYFQTVLYFRQFRKYVGGLRTRIKLFVEALWIRSRIKKVDHVFVQSGLVRDLLCEEFSLDAGSISVMPFADIENLKVSQAPGGRSARNGFFYPALGTPHKNHKLLIDAWVLLARQGLFPQLLLTIDPRFDRLLAELEQARIESKIRATNLGLLAHQEVLNQLLLSEAMIFPSLCESLGLPLLEARENGIPVIASERDYVREILDPVETFDPESALSIARAVKRFLGVGEKPVELVAPEVLVKVILKGRTRPQRLCENRMVPSSAEQFSPGSLRAGRPMRRMAVVITSAYPLNSFLRPHLERLRRNFEITVYVNTGDMGVVPDVPPEVKVVHLPLRRNISPFADLAVLLRLWRILRRERFNLVFSMNPKSGLLAMAAAFITPVPLRIHCFTGQVWATKHGLLRWLLKGTDRLLATCATRVLADSTSQREYLIKEGIVASDKIEVLANGSIAGVDTRRFCPNENARGSIRSRLGIEQDACCFLYVGRLKRDKGVIDLIEAFNKMRLRFPKLHLLLVGPDEEGFDSIVRDLPKIHRVGYTRVVEEYMAAADVFCLPSYREGFGLVLIEAGAAGLPVVASRIYGITDAVDEWKTGLLHEPGDADDLARKMETLIEDSSLRRALGEAGRRRAAAMFSAELVTTAMADFLQRLLAEQSHAG